MYNVCGEIALDRPRFCQMGYPCIACYDQVVGIMTGVCGRCLFAKTFDITIRSDKWIDDDLINGWKTYDV